MSITVVLRIISHDIPQAIALVLTYLQHTHFDFSKLLDGINHDIIDDIVQLWQKRMMCNAATRRIDVSRSGLQGYALRHSLIDVNDLNVGISSCKW